MYAYIIIHGGVNMGNFLDQHTVNDKSLVGFKFDESA